MEDDPLLKKRSKIQRDGTFSEESADEVDHIDIMANHEPKKVE
jgi:hypothetical protein